VSCLSTPPTAPAWGALIAYRTQPAPSVPTTRAQPRAHASARPFRTPSRASPPFSASPGERAHRPSLFIIFCNPKRESPSISAARV
jgi:hypothetical protein